MGRLWPQGLQHSPSVLDASLPIVVLTLLFLSVVFFFPQIFYRVVADIEPGEELLLFMKSEDYSHETMAPDIHG